MLFYVLNTQYESVGIVDEFSEAYWITRYNESGEFKIVLPCTRETVSLLTIGSYMHLVGEDGVMYIPKREQKWTWKEGDKLTVTGYSLEKLLERRVIYDEIVEEEIALDALIKRILTENVISPSDSKRRIPGFVYKECTEASIKSIKLKVSYVGDNVYDVISDLCKIYNVGFRVLPLSGGGYEFSLYLGKDRSYAQSTNPWIVFSPTMENIGTVTLTENTENFKNVAWVRNARDYREAETDEHGIKTGVYIEETVVTTQEAYAEGLSTAPSGLDRHEIYVESSKSNKDEDGKQLEDAEYKEILKQQGEEELADHKTTAVFTGAVDDGWQYEYNRDFFMGDICQIINKFGIEQRVRVEEVVRTHDNTGDHAVPSFVNVD